MRSVSSAPGARRPVRGPRTLLAGAAAVLLACGASGPAVHSQGAGARQFNDSHFHLTNYVQEGTDVRALVKMMGTTHQPFDAVRDPAAAGVVVRQHGGLRAHLLPADRRAALLLLVHRCLHRQRRTGRCLPPERARLDPMITGFNPADMYAADHIRRVLRTFPGVFTGIGEFTIHKEFVSSKVAGDAASPDEPGARPRVRGGRRDRPGRAHPQRHQHAVSAPEPGAVHAGPDEGALRAAPPDVRSSGRTPGSAAS